MTAENGLARRIETPMEMQPSAAPVVGMTRVIQEVMNAVMKSGQHYGVVPGCGDKPALLKPGAEKLCVTFRLAAMPEITWTDLGNGHREARVVCKLVHIPTSETWGVGVGLCSTMESKYRWRKSGATCPNCKKPAIIKGKADYGGGWLCFKKKGGCGSTWQDGSPEGKSFATAETKEENPDLADQYNTVLKMAKKRALVDATLTATAASDIFTQDIDELMDTEARMGGAPPPAQRETPQVPLDHYDEPPPEQQGSPAVKQLSPQERLLQAVKAWSGVKPEDAVTAVRDAQKAAGVKQAGKKMSNEEAKKVLEWVEANKGRDFAEALAG